MWALCFGSFEVKEADLIPEQRSDVPLQRCETGCGAVTETMYAYALCQAYKCAYYDRCSSRYLRSAEWDLLELA
jgi:hypothetical protein